MISTVHDSYLTRFLAWILPYTIPSMNPTLHDLWYNSFFYREKTHIFSRFKKKIWKHKNKLSNFSGKILPHLKRKARALVSMNPTLHDSCHDSYRTLFMIWFLPYMIPTRHVFWHDSYLTRFLTWFLTWFLHDRVPIPYTMFPSLPRQGFTPPEAQGPGAGQHAREEERGERHSAGTVWRGGRQRGRAKWRRGARRLCLPDHLSRVQNESVKPY